MENPVTWRYTRYGVSDFQTVDILRGYSFAVKKTPIGSGMAFFDKMDSLSQSHVQQHHDSKAQHHANGGDV